MAISILAVKIILVGNKFVGVFEALSGGMAR